MDNSTNSKPVDTCIFGMNFMVSDLRKKVDGSMGTRLFLAAALESLLKRAFIWRSGNLQDNGVMHAVHSLSRRTTPGLLLGLVLLAVQPQTQAKDRDDHERAQAAVIAGQIMPLDRLLQRVALEHPGQVLEVELEREHEHEQGPWIYEIKLLQSDGQLLKIKVDARTGEVLSKRVRAASRH